MKNRLREELEAMRNLQPGDSFTADNVHTLVDGILEGGGFKYINYDSTSFPYPQTIGSTISSISGLGPANESMIDTIFIMPNKETNPDATLMIVVDEVTPETNPKTYQYVYVGNINNLPSDVLTESSIVDIPGTNLKSVMSQKGATDLVSEYNVSANNNNTEYTFSQAVALVPVSLQKGGLTIKYIDSTTHEYVIKRLMSSTWNTTESNWKSVDRFETGQAVNVVKIKDENGERVQGTADVFSAEAGELLGNGIRQLEQKVTNIVPFVLPEWKMDYFIDTNNALTSLAPGETYRYGAIKDMDISEYDHITLYLTAINLAYVILSDENGIIERIQSIPGEEFIDIQSLHSRGVTKLSISNNFVPTPEPAVNAVVEFKQIVDSIRQQGVVLEGEINQLKQKVTNISSPIVHITVSEWQMNHYIDTNNSSTYLAPGETYRYGAIKDMDISEYDHIILYLTALNLAYVILSDENSIIERIQSTQEEETIDIQNLRSRGITKLSMSNNFVSTPKPSVNAVTDDLRLLCSTMQNTQDMPRLKISILGDSISSFSGQIPSGYEAYYPVGDVSSVDDTYWKMLINKHNFELEINNSFSGSSVGESNNTYHIPMSSEERLSNLGSPDIIIFFGGTNDFGLMKNPLGNYDYSGVYTDKKQFSVAYAYVLDQLKQRYPKAKIVCCTLLTRKTRIVSNLYPIKQEEVRSDVADRTTHYMFEFNNVIKELASSYDCYLCDWANCINYYDFADYSVDNAVHPNKKGHTIMSAILYDVVQKIRSLKRYSQ